MTARRHARGAEGGSSPAGASPFRAGVRCGELLFIGAQGDLDWQGRVRHVDDPGAQLRAAVQRVAAVLDELDADLADLVRLTLFHVPGSGMEERDLVAELAACLGPGGAPGPVIAAVPLPWLPPDGLAVMLDGLAMRGGDGARLPRASGWLPGLAAPPAPIPVALRCGELVFTGGVDARGEDDEVAFAGDADAQARLVRARLDALLDVLGASLADTVQGTAWSVETGLLDPVSGRRPTLAAAVNRVALPCLSADGLVLRADVVALAGPGTAGGRDAGLPPRPGLPWHGVAPGDGDGDAPLPGDIATQTRHAMHRLDDGLAAAGMTRADVVRLDVHAAATRGDDALARCRAELARHFEPPGPVVTCVPVPRLARAGQRVQLGFWATR